MREPQPPSRHLLHETSYSSLQEEPTDESFHPWHNTYRDLAANTKEVRRSLPTGKMSRDAMRPACLMRHLTPQSKRGQPIDRIQNTLDAYGELAADQETYEGNAREYLTIG